MTVHGGKSLQFSHSVFPLVKDTLFAVGNSGSALYTIRVFFIIVGVRGGGGGNESLDPRRFSWHLLSVSRALCRLDIDLALWMFDKILLVDCFHFSAPSLVFCLMLLTSSVKRWILRALSSFS